MAAPSFRSAGTFVEDSGWGPKFRSAGTKDSGTGAITPPIPAGATTNDIMLLVVQSSNETISAPSGWTLVTGCDAGTGTAATSGSVRSTVFWKRHSGSESDPTVADTGNHTIGQIFAFSGCVTSGDPLDVTASTTYSTALTWPKCPNLTTTVDNTFVVKIVAHAIDSNSAQANGTEGTGVLARETGAGSYGQSQTNSGTGGGIVVDAGYAPLAGTYNISTGLGPILDSSSKCITFRR